MPVLYTSTHPSSLTLSSLPVPSFYLTFLLFSFLLCHSTPNHSSFMLSVWISITFMGLRFICLGYRKLSSVTTSTLCNHELVIFDAARKPVLLYVYVSVEFLEIVVIYPQHHFGSSAWLCFRFERGTSMCPRETVWRKGCVSDGYEVI